MEGDWPKEKKYDNIDDSEEHNNEGEDYTNLPEILLHVIMDNQAI